MCQVFDQIGEKMDTIRVVCRVNLDLHGEIWPEKMPAVPRVGDLIQSAQIWDGFQLSLQVNRIIWKQGKEYLSKKSYWYAELELGLTEYHRKLPCAKKPECTGSLIAFFEWYAPKVGQSVASFI
jgi:hypothetical protein